MLLFYCELIRLNHIQFFYEKSYINYIMYKKIDLKYIILQYIIYTKYD